MWMTHDLFTNLEVVPYDVRWPAVFEAADRESREACARAKTEFIERIIATALSNGYPREFH